MPNEEWLSIRQYMKRTGKGYETVKYWIDSKQVETRVNENGNQLIKYGGSGVPIETYLAVVKENEKLKSVLVGAQKMLEGVI